MIYNMRDNNMKTAWAYGLGQGLGEVPGNVRYRCAEGKEYTALGDLSKKQLGNTTFLLGGGSIEDYLGDKPADRVYFDDEGNPVKSVIKPVEVLEPTARANKLFSAD